MKPTHDELMSNADYCDAFHTYYQYIAKNRRYAMIYKKKMDNISKRWGNN